jgi:endonuclease/exonuclease/phosphatase (EEP) superfamily protein YafD
VALALITLVVLAARLWWVFDLFSHFRLQYVVLALALLVAALALRAFPAALALIVVVLIHGWAIKDLWFDRTTMASGTGGTPLRVASVNVLEGNPTPGRVVEFARAQDADLLVLVETDRRRWRPVLTAIAEGYPHRAPPDWRDGAPLVLFSRYPITRERDMRSASGRRRYLQTQIALPDRTLTMIAVHTASPSPLDPEDSHERDLQLEQLAASVVQAAPPIIMAGDFNSTPWSPHFQDLLASTGLHNAANGFGWISTFPHGVWPARIPIDHILIKGPLEVLRIGHGPAVGSDHYPIVADLRLLP